MSGSTAVTVTSQPTSGQTTTVYVSGATAIPNAAYSYVATYWVNGAATVLPLPSGATGSSATGIAVSNGDVYVVGNAVEAGGDTAAYWVNDTLETLPTPSGWTDSLANAITVSGSDVYIAGNATTAARAPKPPCTG